MSQQDSTAERFPLITPRQLGKPVPPVEFLIEGLWPVGSFGPWGGPKKSLKTYCASIAAVAVAAGVPAFGQWRVPDSRPVIYYGGEGGQAMHARRLQRIARDVYGIDLGDVPLYLVTDVGPFDSKEFRQALSDHCDKADPGLVILDSLYNYHPAGIEVGNLYDRGRVLSDLSHPLTEADVALWVVDHFNKNGAGLDLDRLAQAGMAQWADSWVLLDHRTQANVSEGRFGLRAEVGSRQWGGMSWDVDLDIGPFDLDSGTHSSPIKVSVDRAGSGGRTAVHGRAMSRDDVMAAIARAVSDRPGRTKSAYVSDVMAEHRVGKERVLDAWRAMVENQLLYGTRTKVDESGRPVTREVWDVGSGRVRKRRASRFGPDDFEPSSPARPVKSSSKNRSAT